MTAKRFAARAEPAHIDADVVDDAGIVPPAAGLTRMTLLEVMALNSALVRADKFSWKGKLGWAATRMSTRLGRILDDTEKMRRSMARANAKKDPLTDEPVMLPTGGFDFENQGKAEDDWSQFIATQTVDVKIHKVTQEMVDKEEMDNGVRRGIAPMIIGIYDDEDNKDI